MKVPFKRTKAPEREGEMTLLEHLIELRKRVIRSVLGIFLGCTIIFLFRGQIFDILKRPYCDYQTEASNECEFLLTGPLDSFSFLLTLVGYGGLVLATPIVLYQMARFVLPGLYPNEKKALIPFIVGSVVLLAGGMLAAYTVMPRALAVLADFGFDGFVAFFSPVQYVGFFVKMLFAFGVAAELPIVLIFLQMVGVVKPETLAKNRRIAIAAITLLGAIITPTGDPVNLAIVAVPMYIFFEISIVVGKLIVRRRDSTPTSAGLTG